MLKASRLLQMVTTVSLEEIHVFPILMLKLPVLKIKILKTLTDAYSYLIMDFPHVIHSTPVLVQVLADLVFSQII